MIGDLLVAVVMVVVGGVLVWATHDRLRLLWSNQGGVGRGVRNFAAMALQLLFSAPIALVWGAGALLIVAGALFFVVRLVGGAA